MSSPKRRCFASRTPNNENEVVQHWPAGPRTQTTTFRSFRPRKDGGVWQLPWRLRNDSKGEIEDDFAFIQTMLEENCRSDGVETGSNGTEDETYEPRSNEYEENEDDDEEFLAEAFDFVDKVISDVVESSRQRKLKWRANVGINISSKNEVSKIVVRAEHDDIVIPEFDYQRHINEEYHVLRGSDDEDNGMMPANFAQAPFG
ncbi:hypothetical protein CRG98_039753 [Punica granatum]|uniref:Uncharacterized protein n=1 Tax=Punica granatum TaxID=22663 RepID=A0A2I0I786_PUNGR|nr:hypothetical protein CRG98_039753 [Punica granatum]